MRRKSFLALVASAFALNGQPLAVSISNSGKSGKTAILQNTSSRSLTAFALTFDRTSTVGSPSHTVFYYDSLVNHSQSALPPGATKTQTFGRGSSPGDSTLTFRAAVFDDGSSFGDPAWVTRLITNRRTLEKYLTTAILKLQSYLQSTSADSVIADFSGMEQLAKTIPDQDEMIIARSVYSGIQRAVNSNQGNGVSISIRISSLLNTFSRQKQQVDAALATTP